MVILKSLKQKQEHICIELRTICFSNAIIVVQATTTNLIKLVDRPLYDQYILERYKGSKPSNDAESLFDKFKTNTKDKLKNSTPLQAYCL